MANKKLFFGASNQDLQRKIDEEKKQQEVKAKRDAYRRYIGPGAGMPLSASDKSSDNRVYFDVLIAGDIRIENQKTFMDMAVNIIAGHLQTHPEDAQRIEDVVKERMWLRQLIHRETHTR